MTDERRVKEVWPQVLKHGRDCPKVEHLGAGYLHEADDDGPYDVDGVAYCGRCHGWMGTDAASRLPKAEETKAKGIAADREREADANAGNYWYPTERMNSPDTWDRPDLDCPNPVKEPAPQTFEEWWAKHERRLRHLHFESDRTESMARLFARLAWNAAKASSPAVVEKERSIDEIAEALFERLDDGNDTVPWKDQRPNTRRWYRRFAEAAVHVLSASPSPAVAGGEGETVEENLMLKKFINDIYGGAAQGLLAYSRFRRKQQPLIKDVRGK